MKVILILEDRPGALADALGPFAHYGINLRTIRSQAVLGQPGVSGFYLEFDEHEDSHTPIGAGWMDPVTFDIRIVKEFPTTLELNIAGKIDLPEECVHAS